MEYGNSYPDEIWENILQYLELSELLRLKRVSKGWNEIITRVIKRACKWYEKCVAEIPENEWSSVLNLQTNPDISCEDFHAAKMHSDVWLSMYRSWIGWKNLNEKNASIETIEVFSDVKFLTHIYLAATGNIIAVGSANGQILFYDISQSLTDPIYQVHHGAPIGNVVLCRKGSDIMAVSYCVDNLRYWDLKARKQIHESPYHRAGRILTANFDYCFSAGADNNDEWILNVEQYRSGTVRSVRTATMSHPHYVVKAMGTDGNKALLFLDSDGLGNKYYVNMPDNTFEALYIDGAAMNDMFLAMNSSFRIFKPCVTTFVSRRGDIFRISVNGRPWKTYDVKRDFDIKGFVTAILYHVGLLVLALNFVQRPAEVRIYLIKDADCLENLDLRTMNFKSLTFSSPSIVDLAVTEYDSRQYLLAVGNRKIHLAKFA